VADRDVAAPLLQLGKAMYPSLQKTFVDCGYLGARTSAAAAAVGVQLQVVKRPSQPKQGWSKAGELPLWPVESAAVHGPFPILPKRWIVERNNAWSERPRRMNRDHDRLMSVSESWIWLTQGRMLLAKWTASKEA
jgi:transposase